MYISVQLDESQKEKFQDYLKFALSRIKILEYADSSIFTFLNDEQRTVECSLYLVDEIFLNMESFKKLDKYPHLKEGDWQIRERKDGTVWVRSLMCLPIFDKGCAQWEIKANPAIIASYLLFPKVRKYAPKILEETLNPALRNYTTQRKQDGGVPLLSFEGLKYYEQPYVNHIIEYEKESLALYEDELQISIE